MCRWECIGDKENTPCRHIFVDIRMYAELKNFGLTRLESSIRIFLAFVPFPTRKQSEILSVSLGLEISFFKNEPLPLVRSSLCEKALDFLSPLLFLGSCCLACHRQELLGPFKGATNGEFSHTLRHTTFLGPPPQNGPRVERRLLSSKQSPRVCQEEEEELRGGRGVSPVFPCLPSVFSS